MPPAYPAPRLGEVDLTVAREYHAFMPGGAHVEHRVTCDVGFPNCARTGPAIIDLPQAVNAAGNKPPSLCRARRGTTCAGPGGSRRSCWEYGNTREIWALFEGGH